MMKVNKTNVSRHRENISSVGRNRSRDAYKYSLFKKIFDKKKDISSPSKKKKNRNPYIILFKRVIISTSFVFLLAVLAGCIVAAAYVADISKSTTGIDPNNPFKQISNLGDSIIYSADNQELRRISGAESREFIKIDDVPDYVRTAFVAAEDKTFFQNKGVDVLGLARALINTVVKKQTQGGSTITQQVVKVNLVGDQRSLKRKVQELILAIQITNKFTKNEILQLYINSIPFGGTITGLKRAAKVYFNKEVKDLTYAEGALLAGIPQQPSVFAPTVESDPTNQSTELDSDGNRIPLNRFRERYVLDNMYEIADILNKDQGYKIDLQKIKDARNEKIAYNFSKTDSFAPHFTANDGIVEKELRTVLKGLPQYKDKTDDEIQNVITSGGLKIFTTLDSDMQAKATEQVSKISDNSEIIYNLCAYCGRNSRLGTFGANNSAMISVDVKTGAVKAYVGSANFNSTDTTGVLNGQFDVLSQGAGVSQGSSMKPFNYMNTILNVPGISTSSVWQNFPIDFGGGYSPKNFSIGDHPGIGVTTDFAINNSLNRPAVQSLMVGGSNNFGDLLGKFGYRDDEVAQIKSDGLTATLGATSIRPVDHAQAYQTLANMGVRQNLYTIETITDREGNIIYQHQKTDGTRVIDARYPWLIYNVIRNYGTVQTVRRLGYDCGGKTGTNDAGPNGLPTSIVFWGFCGGLLTGVWAGNSNNAPLKPLAVGEKLGQVMWTPYMSQVLTKYPKDKFVRPAGIVDKSICTDTGYLANDTINCPKGTGLFIDGQYPKLDNVHLKLRVTDCNGTLKLASSADEIAGVAKDQTFVRYETLTGRAFIQKQVDDFNQKNLGQLPPTEYCTDPRTSDGSILTKITSPTTGVQYNAGDTISNITATTVGLTGSMKFYFVNSVGVSTFITEDTTAPYNATYTIPIATPPGLYSIKAVWTDSTGKTGQDVVYITVTSSIDSANINITAPTNNKSIAKSVITVTAAATDPSNVISTVKFYAQKNGVGNYVQIGATQTANATDVYSVSYDLSKLTDVGTYQVYAEISNATGSTKSSSIITFYIT